MPRVKRGVTAHARHKKILDLAKGYRGRRKNVYRIVNTLTETDANAKDSLELYGLRVLTQQLVNVVCRIAYL